MQCTMYIFTLYTGKRQKKKLLEIKNENHSHVKILIDSLCCCEKQKRNVTDSDKM